MSTFNSLAIGRLLRETLYVNELLVLICTLPGVLLGGHVRVVFTLVLFIFVFCVATTLTSFNEIPLDVLTTPALRVSSKISM